MLTDIQIRYINSSLDRLTLKEIEEKMHVANLSEQLKKEGYVYSSVEKQYVKEVVEQLDLDYKTILEMDARESFSYRVDPIIKAQWEVLIATPKFRKIPKGKLLSLALSEFIEKYK